jgi:hypothetical protein
MDTFRRAAANLPETLDYERAALVVGALVGAVAVK